MEFSYTELHNNKNHKLPVDRKYWCPSILKVEKIEYYVCYISHIAPSHSTAQCQWDGVNLAKLLLSSLHLVSSPSLTPQYSSTQFSTDHIWNCSLLKLVTFLNGHILNWSYLELSYLELIKNVILRWYVFSFAHIFN